MKIAVLFDGAGLSRLGLEQAGHDCTGFELDPSKHALSLHVGSGNCVLADVRDVDLTGFDAVWASPPCQTRSAAKTQGAAISPYSDDLLDWSLALETDVLWVENIIARVKGKDDWGVRYNAAQFLEVPIQNRNRIVGGRFLPPYVFHEYRYAFTGICPSILASEYKGSAVDTRRASRFYGRRLTIDECAYHQGFDVPKAWNEVPEGWIPYKWRINQYEAIGNGVPVYMAKAFGERYT